jgi:hypothetical protein
MLEMKVSNIVIINAQNVVYYMIADTVIVENRSIIIYVLLAINHAIRSSVAAVTTAATRTCECN